MTVDWNAIGAVSTAGATLVALGLGWRSEVRTSRESKRADERLAKQRDEIEKARQREFLLDRLTQLAEAYSASVAYQGMAQGGEAGQRVRVLLNFLPTDYATILRHQYQLGSRPDHEPLWRPFVPDEVEQLPPTPSDAWVQAELAANMRDALGRPDPLA